MITLEINNSECKILGLSIEQTKVVRDLTSYNTDPNLSYYTGGFRSTKRYLIDKKGTFPTGILYIVKDYLDSKHMEYDTFDHRVEPMPLKSFPKLALPYSPYPEQIDAALACSREKRGIVVASTGFGKSIIIALVIDQLKVPTLIIVPNLELKRQLQASLDLYFGKTKLIAVENIDSGSISKISKNFQAIIIDEYHHSAAKTYRDHNKKHWNHIFYKIGLSATPFRSQDHERLLLESVLSKVIYKIPYDKAVKSGYIVPMEAYFIELPKTSYNGPNSWASVYSRLVVNNDARNEIIATLALNAQQQGLSLLALVKEIKHGENLIKLTKGFFANGVNDDTPYLIQMFNSTKLKVLIGTTGVIGEGIDTKPAEYVVIAGLGKSKNAFMQQCGRGFRVFPNKTSCKIIIFKDNSHKWTKAHFAAQVKILKEEYGVVPIKLNIV